MSSESFEQPTSTPTKIDKRTRLDMIYNDLKNFPPVDSAQRAHALVVSTFVDVEHYKISSKNQEGGRMGVASFNPKQVITYNGKTIYFLSTIKQLMFFGENGAIEVVRNEESDPAMIVKNIQKMKENSYSEFSKPGADGKDIWGN